MGEMPITTYAVRMALQYYRLLLHVTRAFKSLAASAGQGQQAHPCPPPSLPLEQPTWSHAPAASNGLTRPTRASGIEDFSSCIAASFDSNMWSSGATCGSSACLRLRSSMGTARAGGVVCFVQQRHSMCWCTALPQAALVHGHCAHVWFALHSLCWCSALERQQPGAAQACAAVLQHGIVPLARQPGAHGRHFGRTMATASGSSPQRSQVLQLEIDGLKGAAYVLKNLFLRTAQLCPLLEGHAERLSLEGSWPDQALRQPANRKRTCAAPDAGDVHVVAVVLEDHVRDSDLRHPGVCASGFVRCAYVVCVSMCVFVWSCVAYVRVCSCVSVCKQVGASRLTSWGGVSCCGNAASPLLARLQSRTGAALPLPMHHAPVELPSSSSSWLVAAMRMGFAPLMFRLSSLASQIFGASSDQLAGCGGSSARGCEAYAQQQQQQQQPHRSNMVAPAAVGGLRACMHGGHTCGGAIAAASRECVWGWAPHPGKACHAGSEAGASAHKSQAWAAPSGGARAE